MNANSAFPVLAASSEERIRRSDKATWAEMDGHILAPVAVEIQPTAHCHRTCAFCSHIIRNRRGGELSYQDIDSLLLELTEMGVSDIAFSGGGEPLFWKAGRLVDVIDKAARFSTVTLTTSGDQFWNDERQTLDGDALTILRLCRNMYINVPAVEEASFALQVKGPSGWMHTRQVLTSLVEHNRVHSEPRCKLYGVVVVTSFNVSQIANIDSTLMSIGLDGIYYKQYKEFEGRNVAKIRLGDRTMAARLEEIPIAQRSSPLSEFIASLSIEYSETCECWMNRTGHNAVVDPNGDIFLCTPTVGKPEHCIGNLDSGGFSACWTGELRRVALRQLSALSRGGLCPRECREHVNNRLIDQQIRQRQ